MIYIEFHTQNRHVHRHSGNPKLILPKPKWPTTILIIKTKTLHIKQGLHNNLDRVSSTYPKRNKL